MVKVISERAIKGEDVREIVRLLRQLRVKALQQPGYISGETLHAVDDPNLYLVISVWESLEDWQRWEKNPERQAMVGEIDALLQSKPRTQVFTP